MRRLLVAVALALAVVQVAHAEDGYTSEDTLAAIDAAAADTGVPRAWLLAIVRCESRLEPYAIGRRGELGAVQLHPRGLLPVFYAVGYTDPFNPYESVYFLAEQLLRGRARHWACA